MRQTPFFRKLTDFAAARLRRRSESPSGAGDATPLRAALFSNDQMEQHGRALACAHGLTAAGAPERLLTRLDANERVLIDTCRLLTEVATAKLRITPAGEWLLDNYYLVEGQIRTARQHLPKGYSRELPCLAQGPSAGLPRVYDLALAAISHGDGHVDAETLRRLVAAYQTVTPLTLGELWAIPIMLRLAMIENLRRAGSRITVARHQIKQAQEWADQMMRTAEHDPNSLILVTADMARSKPPMSGPFVAELARLLQGHGPALALPLTWIEQRLAESSLTIERVVLMENQQQAADQVSISNTIAGMRFLGAEDWREFVESMSFVEQTLREDPGGVYPAMDFATRDRYRHVIGTLAKRSGLCETAVARSAIDLAARRAASHGWGSHTAHVGYFLIDRGLTELEAAAAIPIPPAIRLGRAVANAPILAYVGPIVLITAVVAGGLLALAYAHGVTGWLLLTLIPLTLLGASQLASALVNWIATLLVAPQRLPRMDYTNGLPSDQRALVVIPTMLTGTENGERLLEALEVRFLGNRDENLQFALLTDFADADRQTMPGDEALLRQVQAGIQQLNDNYPGTGIGRFFLLHRPRRWNPAERVWMGYERKRGKLAALNSLLRGGTSDTFSTTVGDIGSLSGVRYVITLDTDTLLPRDAARQFVGTLAHPLNRPRHDEATGIVIGGYGILQPRIGTTLSGSDWSRFRHLCDSEPGIDPYTRSVSDVYQDVFGEGSFIGKGIYDVDAFERALAGRFPENQILSHDLLEGCFARSGLLSDVQLFEEYPASYGADASRQQRWIRGDWQNWPWLLPWVPGPSSRWIRNPLSALSRWKILDNLRRHLAQPALLIVLLVAWALLPQPWLWTGAVVAAGLLPAILLSLVHLCRRPEPLAWKQHLGVVLRAGQRSLALAGFRLACLPHESLAAVDALLRTLWRRHVSGRKMLEWRVATERLEAAQSSLAAAYRALWFSPALAAATATGLSLTRPETLVIAVPLLLLWTAAPALAWWLSTPPVQQSHPLTAVQVTFLRRLSRRTWAFFDHFVVAAENWLPPDNYQESPGPLIAHRTSPTNLGLGLLANLAANDFGYIPAGGLLERTAATLRTMATLERHHGHFFNWYDTRTLLPLPPRYVSSVDSGNLAGHLLTLRAGLLAVPGQPIVGARLFAGLRDTLEVMAEELPAIPQDHLDALRSTLDAACAAAPASLVVVQVCLEALAAHAVAPEGGPRAGDAAPGPEETEAVDWATAFARQCRAALDDLHHLLPWLRPLREGGDRQWLAALDGIPTLAGLRAFTAGLRTRIDEQLHGCASVHEHRRLTQLREQIDAGGRHADARMRTCAQLAQQADEFAAMDFRFLYDDARHLLAVGYNVDELRRDTSCYDLLASEARLGSFVAIAQGQVPQDNWFALGRLLTTSRGRPVLLSWGGSMFEYLMPMLVMPSYRGTLLDQSCRHAVAWQIAHGARHSRPWGVSESGYNVVDAALNYQYHGFGVPGLGIRRGLAEDSVVAPYASVLALMVAPDAACKNLERLADEGMAGPFGFYEAIDYTPARLAHGQAGTIVRSFMIHHQGMNLLALAHLLLDQPMQKRFAAAPLFQTALPLLQERVPLATAAATRHGEITEAGTFQDRPAGSIHGPIGPDTATPEVQLLSNGSYHVMLTNAGGGYSRWQDLAVTRWREDSTRDNWGTFVYLRDVQSGEFWSTTHQPTLKVAQSYEATFSEGRAEFRRRDHDLESYTEIVVSPEEDIELRRVRITNRSRSRRVIELTSYTEVVLATPAADQLQTGFGNLFVQTEIVADSHAILSSRRPRSAGERTACTFHLVAAHHTVISEISYETDRMRFIGRGRTTEHPLAMDEVGDLSGTQGSVLDPIVAIRCRVHLDAEQTATIDLVYGAADSRERCMSLVHKYQDRHLGDRVFDVARTHSGVTLRQLNTTESDAQLYRRLAGSVLYAHGSLRADAATLLRNRSGQSGLWGYSISGDLPIVMLTIANSEQIDLARQLIQCHAYWRLKGLPVDLVISNEDHVGYRQRLQEQIIGLIATGTEAHAAGRPGGIFLRADAQISADDRVLLHSVARVIIADGRGSLTEQVNRRPFAVQSIPRLTPVEPAPARSPPDQPAARTDLILGTDLGGFSADGREYIITTAPPTRMTPAPWVNVLANPHFGTVVTESGLAYTWSENAHEFRLTPWSDDPVGASGGEALYLRDEDSGHYWSPTAQPVAGSGAYVCRHGFGYSVFEHTEDGIRSELWVYVDLEEAVKFSVLKVRNISGRPRRLSATGYVEWVLGNLRTKFAMHVITEIDSGSGALLAHNAFHSDFAGRAAFFDVDDVSRTLTGDRSEFLGRNGSLGHPDALTRVRLSGRFGAAMDPCGALQVSFDLASGQEHEVIFRLGAASTAQDARKLALRLRTPGTARAALERVHQYWRDTLGAVQVQTPDPALNVMANGWLLYQTLACRLWGRSGFYQSGGAFGFRDQLQDTMALVHAQPALAREHLLLCASRQFGEGDVQHWWHPPHGRGVRTRCSDDYLWLPHAVCHYLRNTGDSRVLDEPAPFLHGRALLDEEESYYDLPGRSDQTATLYEHCVAAIVHGLRFGERGLPLMGSGDWNDGMNLVGIHGKGESVWLGFFLYDVLVSFAELARQRSDDPFAERCLAEAERLRLNLDLHGWDGQWYRRAYFDDGTPLGSSANPECAIDSIAQSWSVLSGAGAAERSRTAMASMDRHLVRRDDQLIQLLDPPFDTSHLDPGYIKGYVPGVRENGGQYTHAAVWAAMAFAELGDSRRAWELQALINPVNHASSPEAVAVYRAEPYVVAADVYGVPPHTGRGGWTWYTGSAGWVYRLMVESLLGLRRQGDRLHIVPCLPEAWRSYTLDYRHGATSYHIIVTQQSRPDDSAGQRVALDGVDQEEPGIRLIDDGRHHTVDVKLNRRPSAQAHGRDAAAATSPVSALATVQPELPEDPFR